MAALEFFSMREKVAIDRMRGAIDLAEIIFPGIGLAFQVHDSDDKYLIVGALVDHRIGKTVGQATMRTGGEFGPCRGEAKNTANCAADFRSEIKAEAGALFIVIGNRIAQFCFSCREKIHGAGRGHLTSLAKTSSLGMAENSPRRKASTRLSASSAQS